MTEDPLRRLADRLAAEREHSHVSAETLERLRAIVLEREDEPEKLDETARRIVAGLSSEELAELVADWLGAQTAL